MNGNPVEYGVVRRTIADRGSWNCTEQVAHRRDSGRPSRIVGWTYD
jgi:hypothetical protein